MPLPPTLRLLVEPTPADAARRAALFFSDAICTAVRDRGRARIAVSGGSTPEATFRLLADPAEPFRSRIPWQNLELFWVDERCVPPDHAESNYRMTRTALLDHVPIPHDQIHRMQGEEPPAIAAGRYEIVLRRSFATGPDEVPSLDLVALGMGDDGHTASLFPHTQALHADHNLAVFNFVPQKECYRLTLTAPLINQARQVCFLISGSSKARIVHEVFCGPRDPERLPSQLINPVGGILTVILDRAAAADLTPQAVMAPGC